MCALVTGVQTCALPIYRPSMEHFAKVRELSVLRWMHFQTSRTVVDGNAVIPFDTPELKIEMLVYASKYDCRPVARKVLETAALLRERQIGRETGSGKVGREGYIRDGDD